MIGLIFVAICIIILFALFLYNYISIYNLQNSTEDLDSRLNIVSKSNSEYYDCNITMIKRDLQKSIDSNINTMTKNQSNIDFGQDSLISSNISKIKNMNSNITYEINPKLTTFAGNVVSLEGNIVSNTASIGDLNTLNSQYNTQFAALSNFMVGKNTYIFSRLNQNSNNIYSNNSNNSNNIRINSNNIYNNNSNNFNNIRINSNNIVKNYGDHTTLSLQLLDLSTEVDAHMAKRGAAAHAAPVLVPK